MRVFLRDASAVFFTLALSKVSASFNDAGTQGKDIHNTDLKEVRSAGARSDSVSRSI